MTGLKERLSDQRGAVAVVAAVSLAAFLGAAALAVDVGHLTAVKSELKQAADAGALAGARALTPYTTSSNPPQPNWYQGRTWATQTVQNNRVEGEALTHCQIQSGYWNLTSKILQSTAINPGPMDVPAAQVTVTKASGQNEGPLPMLFAGIFGKNLQNVAAQSTAIISSPSSLPPHGAFPVATPKELVEQYWYQDPPVSFRIGSSYHDPMGGQWTTFKTDTNSASDMRDLIREGNPTNLAIGDNIWIQPGTETSVYGSVDAKIGQTVMLPVVQTDFDTHAYTPILGFVAFYIEDVKGGSGKYIQGHFVKEHVVPNGTLGGAPFYGTFVPPKLVF